jgi:uncharacterized membrane protein
MPVTRPREIIMRLKLLPSTLLLAFCAASAFAAPQVSYRLIPIPDLDVRGLNNRGEVVGQRNSPDGQSAVLWSDGVSTDLRSVINPAANYIEATGINDRSQVAGFYLAPDTGVFRGFLLDRGEVTEVEGPPGAAGVFLGTLNDREQILGSAYYADGSEASFIYEDGSLRLLDPSFSPVDLNVSGTLAGTQFSESRRAAIWRDGVITPIAADPSSGSDINDRGQVIGSLVQTTGSRAFVWERGRVIVLPALLADQTSSWANDINNAGRIVGETTRNQPGSSTQQFATVWDDGTVTDLNSLIHRDDPLRAFVSLTTATLINDRGEIVARGTDSRTVGLNYYFLAPVRGR